MNRFKRRGGSIEYWIKAISEASRAGRETAGILKDIWKALIKNLEEELPSIIPMKGPYDLDLHGKTKASDYYHSATEKQFFGIDSSRTKPIRVGFKYVAFVSSASVKVLIKNKSIVESELISLGVKKTLLPESSDLSSYKLELEKEMFDLEVGALANTVNLIIKNGIGSDSVVMLDGPLVDPPNLVARASKNESFAEDAEKLVERRAILLAALYKQGVPVIGFVKRLHGDIFIKEYLGEKGENYRKHVGDLALSFAIAQVLSRKAREYGLCDPRRPILVVTKPIPLPSDKIKDAPIYNEKLEEKVGQGVGIYTSIYVPAYCSGNRKTAGRIEFIAKEGNEETELIKAAALTEATVYPGTYLPLPVLVAHKKCTIRRREGTKLLREVISKHLVESLSADLPSLLELFSE